MKEGRKEGRRGGRYEREGEKIEKKRRILRSLNKNFGFSSEIVQPHPYLTFSLILHTNEKKKNSNDGYVTPFSFSKLNEYTQKIIRSKND